MAEFLNISVVDVQIWEPGCTCHESPAVIEEDISPDCPLHGFEDDEFLSMADNPAWCERTNTIQYRVYKAIKKTGLRCLVSYAAYPNEKDEDGLPIDNLDVVATPQRIVLIYGPSKYFGTGQRYISTILEAPTWLDLAVCANTAIHVTGDRNHIFFEDIMVVDEDSLKPATRLKMERLNVDRIYRLCMGS